MNIKLTTGNAYRIDQAGELETAPLNLDGSIESDSWYNVEFDLISDAEKTYCRTIMAELAP